MKNIDFLNCLRLVRILFTHSFLAINIHVNFIITFNWKTWKSHQLFSIHTQKQVISKNRKKIQITEIFQWYKIIVLRTNNKCTAIHQEDIVIYMKSTFSLA